MSVNSVNGISQMQNAQGVSFGSSNQDEGSGLDIGKLLVGGVVVAAVAGVGIAGYKSGKTLKEGDGVLTTVWNGIKSWFGKNGDDVAQVAKKYVDLDDVDSLTNSQKIAKAQEVLDATKNNLTVSNNKALKHMENIEDITNSLFKKGKNGKSTKDMIDKIDDTLFAKINGTKGLEGAFELTEAGKLKINGTEGLNKIKAYFSKDNKRCIIDLGPYTLKENSEINTTILQNLFACKQSYYEKKFTHISHKLNWINSKHVDINNVDDILTNSKISKHVNQKADFEQMARSEYYKAHEELLIARAKKAGLDNNFANNLFNKPSSPSTTSVGGGRHAYRVTSNSLQDLPPAPRRPAPTLPARSSLSSSLLNSSTRSAVISSNTSINEQLSSLTDFDLQTMSTI